MTRAPRIAIVGGGLCGSLAGLVLRSRGLNPTLFDAGRRSTGGRLLGGRHADSGMQFLRASEPRFAAITHMLAKEGLIAPWVGRFGLLGSQGGGYLPSEVLASTPIGSMMRETDSGEAGRVDFCGLLGGDTERHPIYVGTPSNADVLPGLCRAAGLEVVLGAKLTGAERQADGDAGADGGGTWRLHFDGVAAPPAPFDAVLLATHDAALAASVVRSAVLPTLDDAPAAAERLGELADALRAQREQRTAAVYTWSGYLPVGFSAQLPFDAVAVPGSPAVHFLARDASKPGRPALVRMPGAAAAGDGGASEGAPEGELWTAVSTPEFAARMGAQESLAAGERGDSERGGGTAAAAAAAMSDEVRRLLAPFAPLPPVRAAAKRWGAGFASGTLGLQEECVSLEPWRLAIAGDFVAARGAGARSPAEAAALSGMEAAERVATWFGAGGQE